MSTIENGKVVNDTVRHDNGDVYIGDSPFQTMGGRWVANRCDALNWKGWYSWRRADGSIRHPMDNWPSDAVMGEKVAALYHAWAEAKSDYELARQERDALARPEAAKRAEDRDTKRIIDAAREGMSEKEFTKLAAESPNAHDLKVRRRVAAGKVAALEPVAQEAAKALVAALNDEREQQAALKRAVDGKREADANVIKLEAALSAAKAKAGSAGRDLVYAAEWRNVSAREAMTSE